MMMSGCKKEVEQTPISIKVDEESILKTSNLISEDLLSQNKDIVDKLSNSFKEKMPANTLLKMFSDYTSGLEFIKKADTFVVNKSCAYNYLEYKEKTVKVYMCFDDQLKVKSMIMNELKVLPALNDNDVLKEQAVLVGNTPQLNGILTLPKGVEKPMVVVMVQASGPSNLNEQINENKPFEDIAYGLAKQGIASLRFDKRSYAFPESINLEYATVSDEYFYDVSSAIHMLEKYPVDPFKIYLLGHSLAGSLAFSIVDQHPELKGAIVMAGSPRNLVDIIYDQAEASLKLQSNMDEDTLNKSLQTYKEAIESIKALTDESEHSIILNVNSEYWNSLNKNSFENYKEINRKFLIIQGEKDGQVYFEKDYNIFKETLGKNKKVTLKSYPDLNHLFMVTNENPLDYSIKSNVSNEVIEDIAKWMNGEDILKVKKK